jgi:hypothetical protein
LQGKREQEFQGEKRGDEIRFQTHTHRQSMSGKVKRGEHPRVLGLVGSRKRRKNGCEGALDTHIAKQQNHVFPFFFVIVVPFIYHSLR